MLINFILQYHFLRKHQTQGQASKRLEGDLVGIYLPDQSTTRLITIIIS